MTPMVDIALFAWVPLTLAMFMVMPPRRAILTAYIGGWLFLPLAGYALPGLPDFNKNTATNYAVFVGVLLFDAARLLAFRPRLLDVAMFVWCLVPGLSSMQNGMGLHDALSSVLRQVTTWGVPYLMGRLYFTDMRAARELAIGIFVGGLVYVPLCLYEIKMSPQLHNLVYGYHQASFEQTYRFGGWRPTVFMQHGLMVAAWMASTAVVGLWLVAGRSVRPMFSLPASWLAAALLVTAVLCKSMGAWFLLLVGMGSLVAGRYVRLPTVIIVLALIPPVYAFARVQGLWHGEGIVEPIRMFFPLRAASLDYRLINEDLLISRAMQRPLLGWGGGGFRVVDAEGRDVSTTDGLWIIYLGLYGLVGLASLMGVLVLPAISVVWRLRRLRVADEWSMPAYGLATIAVLFAIDTLPNAMINPIFSLIAGSLVSLGGSLAVAARQRRPAGQVLRQPMPGRLAEQLQA